MPVSIPLDGLGMDKTAKLDLVNRMNRFDTRKWVLGEHPSYSSGQAINLIFDHSPYQSNQARINL